MRFPRSGHFAGESENGPFGPSGTLQQSEAGGLGDRGRS